MILEFIRVSKSNRRKIILEDVCFSQPKNISIGILGARGSGKSTLINLALGAIHADSGRIRRNGRLSMPIGFPAMLNRYLSGEENAQFIARIFGLDPKSVCTFVEEFADLGPVLKRPLSSYNSALRSRLAFAISYAIPADCFIADGILFGGDAGFRDKCLAMAKQKRKEAAFLFTTGSPRDMRLFADVGAVIQNKRVVFYPTVADAIKAFGQGKNSDNTTLDDEPSLGQDPFDDPPDF